MRYVIGMDISKATSEVAILKDGDLIKQFKIENNLIGFQQLNHEIKLCSPAPEIIFEATGVYSRRIQAFLIHQRYEFIRMNPLASKKELDQLRPNKNDKSDAYNLAYAQHIFKHQPTYVEEPIYVEMRIMGRYYQQCVSDMVTLKNRLHRALQDTFPEVEQLLSKTEGDQYWAIINLFPHHELVTNHSLHTISDLIAAEVEYPISKERADVLAEKLYKLASVSCSVVGVNSHLIYEIRRICAEIKALKREKEQIIKQMVQLATSLPEFEILMSIPGFGKTTSVSLIAELGDLHRFKNPNKINAFIGIDLRFNDSGNHKSSGFITKRGSKVARKVLFKAVLNMAAAAALGHPSHINDWYQQKKQSNPSRGMKKIAIGAMDRLVSTVYHLVLTNQRYDYDIAYRRHH